MCDKLSPTNCWANNKLFKEENNITLEIAEKYSEDDDLPGSKLTFLERPSYPADKKLTRLLENLKIYRDKRKKERFENWLNTNIDKLDNSNSKKVKDVLHYMMNNIKDLVEANSYIITDENQLKNEVATFIYNNS